MRKHTENRIDNLAESNKSGKNPHLSDEQLLLALDGELSSRETARVAVHLEACWSCRARSEQIGEAIADVVEYRHFLSKSQFPPSTRARAMFVAQLEQLSRTVGRPSLWSRIVGTLRGVRTISRVVVPRHVWVSGAVVFAFTLFLLMRLWDGPKVSASQLLENARTSEIRALHRVAKPVVYQKVRIRMGSQDVTRTIYRDLGGKRQSDRLDITNSIDKAAADSGSSLSPVASHSNDSQVAEVELQQTFQTVRFNWEDPLSPATYGAWRNRLSLKQDEVTEVGNDLITLKTTTPEGPISEATITVRIADFHPVAEDLRLKDRRQVEVRELAWEVIPMEAINPAIFTVEPTPYPLLAHPLFRGPVGPTDAELAEAELQVRVAMHAEGADLGEQIELDREKADSAPNGQRSLVVRGIVSTAERKAELSTAFRGIPHVELQLKSVDEAAAQQGQIESDELQRAAKQQSTTSDWASVQNLDDPVTQEQLEGPRPVLANSVGGEPVLEEQLEKRFPNAEERTAFVNRTVEIAQDALAKAWALRRLQDRYVPQAVAELGPQSRQTLELLIRDDVSALRQDVGSAQSLFSPMLSPDLTNDVSGLPAPNTQRPATEPASDWRSTIKDVFPEVQRMHTNVVALFARSTETVSNGQASARDLQVTLIKLEAQLLMLYQNVSGPFVSK
jgi:anti-sigma factor RsiW